MRYRFLIIGALLCLAPRPGLAQQPAVPPVLSGFTGTVDVGGLFTGTDGDEARYERYRDMRDGVYTGINVSRQNERSLFDASASHIGYRDQRYAARFIGSRVRINFDWQSIPLNYSYLTRTPYTISGNTLTLDNSAQNSVQGPTNATNDGTAVGVPCAPGAPPAACSNPAQAGQAKSNRSIYESLAAPIDLRHGRDNATIGAIFSAAESVEIDALFASSRREGQQPWGASFAFNNTVELPQTLDQRTNDMTLGATWTNARSMFRVGWDGSWFSNNNDTLVWDNPIRLTDFNNGLLPPNGPYDPNGYSNGNGPAQGRMALAPNNSMNVVSATAMYKLPSRTTVNGTLQFTNQRQNDDLIDWTVNPLIDSPTVHSAFPRLAQLPRPTAEAEAQGINALINLSSRPFRHGTFTVRYRYNDRDVKTPTFDATEYVRFDAVPEEIEEGLSHQFDTSRQMFDANFALVPVSWGTLRLGYGHEGVVRHGRGFSDVGENIFRATFDTYTSQYLTFRASYDMGWRRGEGFVETGVDYETGPGGTQPTLRYYDEADRDRTRFSLLATVMPRDTYDVYVQFGGGWDEYFADDSVPVERPNELFGLQSADSTSWNFGINVHPNETLAFGANYGVESYESLQLSRNANPPPDPTWTDPNRNWTLDNTDKINTFSVYLDLPRAARNTDIRFGYDLSDSNNAFVHGGPRIESLAAANQFIPLPDVDNTWQRASVDVQYLLNARVGIGVGWYFEDLDVVDFNTLDTDGPVGFAAETGEPRLDWLGGLTMGYGNRPYTGNTFQARVIYKF
jgi:MtrB/PioB family decaheme-associated outer membrane protein